MNTYKYVYKNFQGTIKATSKFNAQSDAAELLKVPEALSFKVEVFEVVGE
jgi:hypothetical protein